ncbi:MAG: glycine dehydrogenase, partial [Lentisphaerae bacterium]|nr:glycine dehydrogenase [Lentisphaerota bacterium]
MTISAHSPSDVQAMLSELGAPDCDALFAAVPAALQTNLFRLPPGLCEQEMRRRLEDLAARNETRLINFCGGGFYDHFIPAAVHALAGRAEFVTAYTPYQPEVALGTLQAIFEYQTAIVRLTEMEVANASLYDGGSALFEASMMALRITRRRRVLIDQGVHPIYRAMLRSYAANLDFEFIEVPLKDGLADRAALQALLNDQVAALVLQNPNFYGCLDELDDLLASARASGALGIVSVYPLALGLIKTPGAMGADIV